MSKPKLLIIGKNGQLGQALQLEFPGAIAVDRDELDISDWQAVSSYDWSGVDVILNAAAYTNVDGAETDEGRRLAWQINASGVSHIAKIANLHNLALVHVSTDYVFDGQQLTHTEDEPLSPLGVYAQSKAAGDLAVSVVPKHYIIRTSWLIGNGPNFVRTMMGLADKNISPTVVNDQIGRLSFANTLAGAISHLLNNNSSPGVYNVSNDGEPVSWADITRVIFKELGRNDLEVANTTTKEYFASKSGIAPRPLQSTLDLAKIKTTGFVPSDWKAELANYIKGEQH